MVGDQKENRIWGRIRSRDRDWIRFAGLGPWSLEMIKHKTAFTVAAWLFGFGVTTFIGMVTYDTVVRPHNIVAVSGGKAVGWRSADGSLSVLYRRGYDVKQSGEGDIIRKVVCTCPKGSIDEYDVAPIHKVLETGVHEPINRYLATPMQIDVGTKCELETYFLWRPRFAVSGRLALLDKLPFVVQEKSGE